MTHFLYMFILLESNKTCRHFLQIKRYSDTNINSDMVLLHEINAATSNDSFNTTKRQLPTQAFRNKCITRSSRRLFFPGFVYRFAEPPRTPPTEHPRLNRWVF